MAAPWFGEHHDLDGYTSRLLGVSFALLGLPIVALGVAWIHAVWLAVPNCLVVGVGALITAGGSFVAWRGHRTFVQSFAVQAAEAARREELEVVGKTGEEATARVLRASTVGEYGPYLVVDLELEVTRKGHTPYAASVHRVCFDPIEVPTHVCRPRDRP